jgi:hypothetical protein
MIYEHTAERLTRTTFSLPLGEVHALVGGAGDARVLRQRLPAVSR